MLPGIILVAALSVTVFLSLTVFSSRSSNRRTFRRGASASIADLRDGTVTRVTGRIHGQSAPLVAPFSGRPAVRVHCAIINLQLPGTREEFHLQRGVRCELEDMRGDRLTLDLDDPELRVRLIDFPEPEDFRIDRGNPRVVELLEELGLASRTAKDAFRPIGREAVIPDGALVTVRGMVRQPASDSQVILQPVARELLVKIHSE